MSADGKATQTSATDTVAVAEEVWPIGWKRLRTAKSGDHLLVARFNGLQVQVCCRQRYEPHAPQWVADYRVGPPLHKSRLRVWYHGSTLSVAQVVRSLHKSLHPTPSATVRQDGRGEQMFDALTPLDILKRVVPEFEWRLGGDNPFAAPDIEASVGDVRVRVKHFGRQVESGGAGVHVELHHAQGMEEAFVVSRQTDSAERRERLARELREWLAERLPSCLHPRRIEHMAAWEDFSEAGLLWWVNRGLHLFGWAIVLESDSDTGQVLAAYPKRVNYRGFSQASEERGFQRLSRYLKANAPDLLAEVLEEDDDA